MTFQRSFSSSSLNELKRRLNHRMSRLAQESGSDRFVMPVGLFLVLDEAHGGDDTASDVIRRFVLLDYESRNAIDFYFLGWKAISSGPGAALAFDIAAFNECREALKAAGLSQFGGYADLILVDAVYEHGTIALHFEAAIRIDLATAVERKQIASVGSFLQAVVEHASALAADGGDDARPTFRLSDRLGLAMARESLLEWFLDKWGKIIGANQLRSVCVTHLGPVVSLRDL